MKERYYLFKRNGVYYVEDGTTGRQQSLKTKDSVEARRMVPANSISHPRDVVPVNTTLRGVNDNSACTFPPTSLVVLKLKVR